jgi:fructose-bisphosphate aldolase, class I
VIRIDESAGLPSDEAIRLNSIELAQYAVISQAAGLVPIVEPEVLIEGAHTAEAFARVTERVLAEVGFGPRQCPNDDSYLVFLEST